MQTFFFLFHLWDQNDNLRFNTPLESVITPIKKLTAQAEQFRLKKVKQMCSFVWKMFHHAVWDNSIPSKPNV